MSPVVHQLLARSLQAGRMHSEQFRTASPVSSVASSLTSVVSNPFVRQELPRAPPPVPSKSAVSTEDDDVIALADQFGSFDWRDDAFEKIRAQIFSSSTEENRAGVQLLKRRLCTSRDLVFNSAQEVIDAKLVPRLVAFIQDKSIPDDIKLPAAFCLTNIAAGHDEQTAVVVEANAIPPLLEILRNDDAALRRQAIFCLANIAGATSVERRQLAAHELYFPSVILAVRKSSDQKVEELAAWNMRNVCILGGPSYEQIRPGVKFFANVLLSEAHCCYPQDAQAVLRFACETIAAVCKQEMGRMDVRSLDIYKALVSLVRHSPGQTMKNHCLEALWRLVEFGGSVDPQNYIDPLLRVDGVRIVAQVLQKRDQYQPIHRVTAGRILFALSWYGSSLHVKSMASAVTKSLRFLPVDGRQSPDDVVSITPLSTQTVRLLLHEHMVTPLEICFRVWNQCDHNEEQWVREGAGRAFCAAIGRLDEHLITPMLSLDMIKSIVGVVESSVISEMFVQSDIVEKESRLQQERVNSGEGAADDSSISIKSITAPSGVVVGLRAIERLLDVGDFLQEVEGLPVNPIRQLLCNSEEFDGGRRLEHAILQAPLFDQNTCEKVRLLLLRLIADR